VDEMREWRGELCGGSTLTTFILWFVGKLREERLRPRPPWANGIGRGQRKSTFQLQAARNKVRPYDDVDNQYIINIFLPYFSVRI
jgi:hypothetical protein